MSVLSLEEEELVSWLKSSIPKWLWMEITSPEELWGAVAKGLILTRQQADDWNDATFILTATDIWLNQHARDRGTTRQAAETDPALRVRLRSWENSLTRSLLLAEINAALVAEGLPPTATMLEMTRDAAYFGTYISETGTGGTFTKTGSTVYFTPNVLWARRPFNGPDLGLIKKYAVVISGAANAGNNGTFPVLGLSTNAAFYTNASGVAAVDATVSWVSQKRDYAGNPRDTFTRAYTARGYRSWRSGSGIIIILPYGSTAGTEATVREILRLKKAAGIRAYVERRQIP